jgi:hypothetical protein
MKLVYLVNILVVQKVVIFLEHLKNVKKITCLKNGPKRAIPSN